MNMKPKIIEYNGDDISARLAVHPATVRMSLRRQTLQAAGREQMNNDDPPQLGIWQAMTFPDLMAVTTGEIRHGDVETPLEDVSFDEWLDLPESLVMEWEAAVYEANPHWQEQYKKLGEAMSGALQKKEMS